jgi:hypothetical protein
MIEKIDIILITNMVRLIFYYRAGNLAAINLQKYRKHPNTHRNRPASELLQGQLK